MILHGLQDHFSLGIVHEVVCAKDWAVQERLQVVNVDLSRPIEQVSLRHCGRFVVSSSVAAAKVGGLLVQQLAEQEHQQLVVVAFEGQVASEVLLHSPHDGELLRVNEAFQHDADGHIDVVVCYVLADVHTCVGLGHADHGLDVADSDGDGACCHTLPSQFRVHLGHFVLVHLVKLRMNLFSAVNNVLPQ